MKILFNIFGPTFQDDYFYELSIIAQAPILQPACLHITASMHKY